MSSQNIILLVVLVISFSYAISAQLDSKNQYNAPVYCPPRYPDWFRFDLYPPGSKAVHSKRPSNYGSNLPEKYDGPPTGSVPAAHSPGDTVFNAPIHGGIGDAGNANAGSVSIAGRLRRRRTVFNAPVACS